MLWKTLGKMGQAAGQGNCPRKGSNPLSQVRTVDVVLPTRQWMEIRRRYVERPDADQAILLQRLGVHLPEPAAARPAGKKTAASLARSGTERPNLPNKLRNVG